MKKIVYLLTLITLVFSSCSELEDTFDELDTLNEGLDVIVGDATITLSDDDYKTIFYNETDGEIDFDDYDDYEVFFTDNDIAKSLISKHLSDLYPVWGKNSSVLVNYQLESGTDLVSVTDFTNANSYLLANSDYPSATENATAFYETEAASDYIPVILTENFANAEEGDVVLARYNEYVGQTVTGVTEFYTADFQTEGTLLDFETVSVIGDQVWEETQSFGAKMSGFTGVSNENEDWLISKEIDLADYPNATLEVNQVLNFATYDDVDVLISTNYTGDISTANWDVIELTNVPDGSGWTEVLSDEYSLSTYNDETITIAFKYTSTDSGSGTWQINQVILKANGVEGETKFNELYYTYGIDTWELSEGVYYLTSEDYDAMGEESGPGRFNNFSSTLDPNDYIPALLAQKYPFAQEEDSMLIFFKYFNGSTNVRGNEFTYTSGTWAAHETKLQFGHDGIEWLPDNTIKYTLTQADYDLVDNGFFANFDVRKDRDEEDKEVRLAKINTILLNNFPDAAEDQKYLVSYNVWNDGDFVYTMAVIKTGGEYVLQNPDDENEL